MKRVITSSNQWDTNRVGKQMEQTRINEIFENVRSLTYDIEELSLESFTKLQLDNLYNELSEFLQNNSKYYTGRS